MPSFPGWGRVGRRGRRDAVPACGRKLSRGLLVCFLQDKYVTVLLRLCKKPRAGQDARHSKTSSVSPWLRGPHEGESPKRGSPGPVVGSYPYASAAKG